MNNKIVGLLKNPYKTVIYLNNKHLLNWLPDKIFLKLAFRAEMHKKLNLSHPVSYNEKLQWLKLYDRRPEYSKMVDKYEVKQYVAELIGENYIIPTLGVWNSFDEIDFNVLPKQFVLKCTHDSGGLVICKNKDKMDFDEARQKIESCLKKNYYYLWREWPYKYVKPRIIAEQYMEDESGYELKDYKFFCFDGVPKYMFIASDRSNSETETKFDFFDMEFKHLPFRNGHPNAERVFEKIDGFEKMKELASKLSKGIPHVRVDFYSINGQVYFGELTFFHWSGMVCFEPEIWDYKLGDLINLPQKEK